MVANAAFLGLGMVFDYPEVLRDSPEQILASFASSEAAVVGLFLLLAAGAGASFRSRSSSGRQPLAMR